MVLWYPVGNSHYIHVLCSARLSERANIIVRQASFEETMEISPCSWYTTFQFKFLIRTSESEWDPGGQIRSTQITSQNNHFERWPNIQIYMLCLAIYQTTNLWQYSRLYFSGQWPHKILKRLHQKSLGSKVIAATIQTFVIMWSLKRQHGLVSFFKSRWVSVVFLSGQWQHWLHE